MTSTRPVMRPPRFLRSLAIRLFSPPECCSRTRKKNAQACPCGTATNIPTLVTLNASIESAAEQLRTETERAFRSVQREYELAYDEERQLQAQLETQTWLAADLSRQSASTYLLESDAESNQRIYALLVRRQKQLHVIRNSIENNVQLMDRAGVPETPLVRSSSRDWAITVLFGLLLSVGLAFGIDYFDDTIKTPDDVVRRLQTPILSVLPAVRGGSVSLMSGTVSHEFGEAVRSLRSALTFTEGTGSTRIIAVTSAGPGEGKTTVASNLAMAFALGGAKVLLLDADMRRPSIHKQLGMTNAIGLSHVLVGQARIDEAIQATHDPHLFVLTAGHPPPNPSELLSSLQMKRVWASLKTGSFDWVIVDTPPVLAVTDPVVVAQYASGIVFLAGDRRTRTRHAQHALETLGAGGARVIGTVLNHADYDRDKYYYSRNWGSGYTEDLHVTAAA